MECVLKKFKSIAKENILRRKKNIEYNGSKIKICCNDFEDFFLMIVLF